MSEQVKAVNFWCNVLGPNNANNNHIVIENLLHFPTLGLIFLLVCQHDEKGFSVTFEDRKTIIQRRNTYVIATETVIVKSYKLRLDVDDIHKTSIEIIITTIVIKNSDFELQPRCL